MTDDRDAVLANRLAEHGIDVSVVGTPNREHGPAALPPLKPERGRARRRGGRKAEG